MLPLTWAKPLVFWAGLARAGHTGASGLRSRPPCHPAGPVPHRGSGGQLWVNRVQMGSSQQRIAGMPVAPPARLEAPRRKDGARASTRWVSEKRVTSARQRCCSLWDVCGGVRRPGVDVSREARPWGGTGHEPTPSRLGGGGGCRWDRSDAGGFLRAPGKGAASLPPAGFKPHVTGQDGSVELW